MQSWRSLKVLWITTVRAINGLDKLEYPSPPNTAATKLNDVLSGKVTDEERHWAKQQVKGSSVAQSHQAKYAAPVAAEAVDNGSPKRDPLDYSRWENVNADDSEEKPKPSSKPAHKKNQTTKKRTTPTEKIQNMAKTYRELGNQHFKQRNHMQAIEEYTRAIDLNSNPPRKEDRVIPTKLPTDATLYTNRALAYIRLKQFDNAVEDCTEAIKIDSKCTKALWRRAESYRALRKFAQAREDIKRLKEVAEEYEAAQKIKKADNSLLNPGVTLIEVKRLMDTVEREILDEKAEKELKRDFTSIKDWKLLVESFIRQIQTSTTNTSASNVSNQKAQTVSDLLVRLLNADEIDPESFRVYGGLGRLLDPQVLIPGTVDLVIPIIASASIRSEGNRRAISHHLDHIMHAMLAAKKPRQKTMAAATQLLSSGVADAGFADTMCRIDVGGETFGEFVMAFLGAGKGLASDDNITGHLLIFVSRMMKHEPNGFATVTVKWGIEPDALLRTIAPYIRLHKTDVEGASYPPCVFASYCIDAIASSKASASTKAITRDHLTLIQNLWTIIKEIHPADIAACCKSTPPKCITPLLATFHNLLLHTSTPIPDLLEAHSILPTLIHFTSSSDATLVHTSISTLSKLLRHNSAQVSSVVDGWWDEIPMEHLLRVETQPAAQVLAAWLKTGEAKVAEWRKAGGFDIMVQTLKGLENEPQSEKAVGNLALCIAECASKGKIWRITFTFSGASLACWKIAENAAAFHNFGATDPLVLLLREAQDSSVQRNLAIACARICQNCMSEINS